jgi:Oxidoreductase NAD-binding domain
VFIMVATGTGIAPFRSFWRRQFLEDVPNYKCDETLLFALHLSCPLYFRAFKVHCSACVLWSAILSSSILGQQACSRQVMLQGVATCSPS